MIDTPVRLSGESVEESLRAELARGRARGRTLQPILRHLLGSDDTALFADEVLARIRGMLGHVARRLLAAPGANQDVPDPSRVEALSAILLDSSALLAHLHATSLEWQLAERLEQRFAIDPVVPPLLQALIASPEPQTQDMAMRLLASQARWCQGQRRMQVSLAELPGELLHDVLLAVRSVSADGEAIASAEAQLRAAYDEGASRLGLAAHLITDMGNAASVALDLRHAGSALFISALALGSVHARDTVLLWAHESQLTPLALALRAAGQSASGIGQQILMLQPDATLPSGLDRLSPERAGALLAEDHDAGR